MLAKADDKEPQMLERLGSVSQNALSGDSLFL